MQAPKEIRGHIIISSEIEAALERLEKELAPSRVVKFLITDESFKIEHAKAVLAEAYVSESATKYIIIAAYEITDIAQNSLLKLLEEPPSNIEFIIITPTKSMLLPTVRSRLPILKSTKTTSINGLGFSLAKLDYKDVFAFLKEHARVKKDEAKELVETIFRQAVEVERLVLSESQLQNFEMAQKLLNLNARAQSVLAMLLMSFAREK